MTGARQVVELGGRTVEFAPGALENRTVNTATVNASIARQRSGGLVLEAAHLTRVGSVESAVSEIYASKGAHARLNLVSFEAGPLATAAVALRSAGYRSGGDVVTIDGRKHKARIVVFADPKEAWLLVAAHEGAELAAEDAALADRFLTSLRKK